LTIQFSSRVQLPQNVLVRTVDDESFVLNVETECYFGLDPVGSRMLTVLVASESIDAAYRALLDEYQVDAGQLREDLSALIEKLLDHGLVQLSDP
jgi:hypothetical protein